MADGVADDLGVEVAGTAMADFFGYEHHCKRIVSKNHHSVSKTVRKKNYLQFY